jgi:hypothetical protein
MPGESCAITRTGGRPMLTSHSRFATTAELAATFANA